MSMDLYVSIDHAPPTVVEWQQALDEKHLPLRLDEEVDLIKLSGFFPMMLKGRKAGFEYLIEDIDDLSSLYPEIHAAKLKERTALSVTYGGMLGCASAYYSAAALVAKFNGRGFDPEEGRSSTTPNCGRPPSNAMRWQLRNESYVSTGS
jgi:hypothetical protein